MAIRLEDKKAIVAEVSEAASVALSAVVADARGVTVGAMTGLRKEAFMYVLYVTLCCVVWLQVLSLSPSPRRSPALR